MSIYDITHNSLKLFITTTIFIWYYIFANYSISYVIRIVSVWFIRGKDILHLFWSLSITKLLQTFSNISVSRMNRRKKAFNYLTTSNS